MILLIDNYDSFSYNLYQYLGELAGAREIKVIRNDEMSVHEIAKLRLERIIISPGPGRPEDAGVIIDVVKELGEHIPILGVCLGHQAICAAFGGEIVHAPRLMHGKQSMASVDTSSPLFKGISDRTPVARYHSLAVKASSLPSCLKVTASTDAGEVMAVEHVSQPVYGVQFHPESIMTPEGKQMLANFLYI